jgi:GNAT superfamily N-acetyltransferase
MKPEFEIIDIDADNVDKMGFFCYMSKRKAPGYQQKRQWLEARFAEGLKIKMVHEIGGRNTGFIEYIPGEYAWRALYASGYIVIHCLWVVGKGKGKGYASRLIEACLEDARVQGKKGVVMLASDRVWLAGKAVFQQNGFKQVDEYAPFQLLVQRFDGSPDPTFPNDWDERQARFGSGLTVVRTPQCPYIEDGAKTVIDTAAELGLPAREVELRSAAEVQTRAPSPFGVFSILRDGQLLSYYYLLPKELKRILSNQ